LHRLFEGAGGGGVCEGGARGDLLLLRNSP